MCVCVYHDVGERFRNNAFYHIPLWCESIDLFTCQINKCTNDSRLFFEYQFFHPWTQKDCKEFRFLFLVYRPNRIIILFTKKTNKLFTVKLIQKAYTIEQLIFLSRLFYFVIQISQTFFAQMMLLNGHLYNCIREREKNRKRIIRIARCLNHLRKSKIVKLPNVCISIIRSSIIGLTLSQSWISDLFFVLHIPCAICLHSNSASSIDFVRYSSIVLTFASNGIGKMLIA